MQRPQCLQLEYFETGDEVRTDDVDVVAVRLNQLDDFGDEGALQSRVEKSLVEPPMFAIAFSRSDRGRGEKGDVRRRPELTGAAGLLGSARIRSGEAIEQAPHFVKARTSEARSGWRGRLLNLSPIFIEE